MASTLATYARYSRCISLYFCFQSDKALSTSVNFICIFFTRTFSSLNCSCNKNFSFISSSIHSCSAFNRFSCNHSSTSRCFFCSSSSCCLTFFICSIFCSCSFSKSCNLICKILTVSLSFDNSYRSFVLNFVNLITSALSHSLCLNLGSHFARCLTSPFLNLAHTSLIFRFSFSSFVTLSRCSSIKLKLFLQTRSTVFLYIFNVV